jgi:hypothetical protein
MAKMRAKANFPSKSCAASPPIADQSIFSPPFATRDLPRTAGPDGSPSISHLDLAEVLADPLRADALHARAIPLNAEKIICIKVPLKNLADAGILVEERARRYSG